MLHRRYLATSSIREELNQFITAVNSFHPALKYTWEISNTFLAFLAIKISMEGNGLCISVYYKCIDSHSSLWYSSSHSSHAKNSIPFHSFSYFVAYIVKTDFSEKLGAMCQFFDDMAILLLSFKRAIPAPNKLIDSQHYQRLRRKILIAFHSLSHFTFTTEPKQTLSVYLNS